MGLDLNYKDGQWVDEFGLMLGQNPSWNPNGDFGKGDCIGRTLDAYFAYDYEPFVNAVKNCYEIKYDKKGMYVQGYRHPSYKGDEYNDLSRDHILNTLILMKESNNHVFLKFLSENLRWKISDRYKFTIDLWLWMKGIAGNKWAMFAYYLIAVPMMFLTTLLNLLIFKLGGFGKEVHQDKFIAVSKEKLSKKQLFLRGLKFPIYTLFQLAFMMYVSPDSLGKRLIKKICLWQIDEQNFLLRLMFGGTVKSEDIYSYKSMRGWRWSTYLNDLNDRDLYVITDPKQLKANVLDVDLLIKMYKKIKNIKDVVTTTTTKKVVRKITTTTTTKK
jgi:hypothetical protein